MKYRVVWIDDTKSWVDSIRSIIEGYFSEYNLVPEFLIYDSLAGAREQILEKYVDLVLLDHNFDNHDITGADFIQELREKRCFAEIVFYSQNIQNLDLVASDEHHTHRTQRDEMDEYMQKVAEQAYRKYNHPAFMRGLLLSEFIDLENQLEKIIVSCFKDQGEYFRNSILIKRGESFSFSTKHRFLHDLMKQAGKANSDIKNKIDEIGLTTTQFDKKIIKKRNTLAHAYPKYNSENKRITLVSAFPEVDFDGKWFHETREEIHEFKMKLQRIFDMNLVQFVNP